MLRQKQQEVCVSTTARQTLIALAWLGLLLLMGCGSSGSVNVRDVDTPVDADHDGYSTVSDCDDTDAAIHPGATDVCGDDIDQDCSGADIACAACGDALVPSAGCICEGTPHTGGICCGDAWHDSGYCCDGTWQAGVCASCPDGDTDGHTDAVCGGDDCNDALDSVYPGAPEVCGDGTDQDCDGSDETCPACGDGMVATSGCVCGGANHTDGICCSDAWHDSGYCCDGTWQASTCTSCPDGDTDGYTDAACGGDDCNDLLDTVYPGAPEVCGDGVDQDCSGADLACPPDTTPPVLGAGQPSGTLPGGTTQTTLRVTTDEAATCRWSTTADTSYADMSNTFITTRGTSHETVVTGLTDGQSYTYYVRCEDGSGNATTADFVVSFGVRSPDNASGEEASILAEIAFEQSIYAALPVRGTPYYYCDCGVGSDADCVAGDDANDGTAPTAPRRTIEAALSQLASFGDATQHTVSLCNGGAFGFLGTAQNVLAPTGCTAETTCNDLREYSSPVFSSSAKPIIRANPATDKFIQIAGDVGGLRIMNIAMVGNDTPSSTAMFLYNGAHDVLMGNLELSYFGIAVSNNQNGQSKNRRITLTASDIQESSNIAYLGGGYNSTISHNRWRNNGGVNGYSHTIYISNVGSDVTVIGNHIHNPYGAVCYGGMLMGHADIDNLVVKNNFVEIDADKVNAACYGLSFVNVTSNQKYINDFSNALFSGNTTINGGALGMIVSSCPGCVIENNRVVLDWDSGGIKTIGIRVAAYVAQYRTTVGAWDAVSTDNTVRNNTVHFGSGMTGANSGITTDAEGTGHIVANNSISSVQSSGTLTCFAHDYSKDTAPIPPIPLSAYSFIDNNNCHSTTTHNFARWQTAPNATPSYNYYDLAQWQTYTAAFGFDASSTTNAPLYVGAATYDFTPDTGSLLIGAGTGAHKSSHDFTGKIRPDPPGIGAYEP